MSQIRFAELDSENIVQRVIVAKSLEWCEENLGGVWLETFRDKSQRYNYAGIGFTYDEDRDAFIPPKPFESWVLDEASCLWVAPVAYPEDGASYSWDEEAGDWVEVTDG
jgi:hypothetical protein